MELKVSSVFENNGKIPAKYTCDGEDVNPAIKIEGIPEGTQTLVLIVDDPDAPVGNWDHWIVYNIEPRGTIEENTVPGDQGNNTWNRQSWGGPCPPSGTHRYFFKVYALNKRLAFANTPNKEEVEKTMQGHVLARGELVGLYSRG